MDLESCLFFFVILWCLFNGDMRPPSNPTISIEGIGGRPAVPSTEFNNVDINNNVMNEDGGWDRLGFCYKYY